MVKLISSMISSCYLPIILFEFSYKIKVISLSNNFCLDIGLELFSESEYIEKTLLLAVISPNSDGVLDDQFRNIYKMTMSKCNFLILF